MKTVLLYTSLFALLVIGACTSQNFIFDANEYDSFGEKFEVSTNIKSNKQAAKEFKSLSVGDSTRMKFVAPINEVCAKKGCWMVLDLGNDDTAFIKFKDYAYFVPKDAAGRESILSGWAHKKETTVERLRHYAEDAGKSPEEVAKITEPKIEYTFMADGVWLKK